MSKSQLLNIRYSDAKWNVTSSENGEDITNMITGIEISAWPGEPPKAIIHSSTTLLSLLSVESSINPEFAVEEYVVHNTDSGKEYCYEKAPDALKAYKGLKEDYPGWQLRLNLKEKKIE